MTSSGLFSEPQQPPPTSRGLQQVYVQYAQSCSSSLDAGCRCLSTAHCCLQEHALRFEVDVAMRSAAHDHLRAIIRAVLSLLGSCAPLDTQSDLQRSSTFLALSSIYYRPTGDVSAGTGDRSVEVEESGAVDRHRSSSSSSPSALQGGIDVDVMRWYEDALRAQYGRRGKQGHGSPSVSDPLSCPPSLSLLGTGLYPSIRLTRSFFDYLNAHIYEERAPSTAACTPYRLLLDAYVHCMHGAGKTTEDPLDGSADWIMMSSCFPFLIRMALDLSLQQCTDDPNPKWPPYLLMLVGRDDLCGTAAPVADDAMLLLRLLSLTCAYQLR